MSSAKSPPYAPRRDAASRVPITVRRFAGHRAYQEWFDRPLRIAHLTDQHVGRVTPMKIQELAISMTNEMAPDVVVLTGDFVCHSQVYLEDLRTLLAQFAAPVFAVLGNHDHWSGAAGVRQALARAGVDCLNNANTSITLAGHQRLQIVGLDDAYTGHADVRRATRGLNPALPTLGLSHIAEMAEPLWHHGVPLVLSGHTHAGQVTVAKLHELSIGKLAGHRYVHGLYGCRGANGARRDSGKASSVPLAHGTRAPQGAVYVGAGIGASVVPIRIGERAKREITLFELGLAPGSIDEHHREQKPLPGRPRARAGKNRALEPA